MLPGMIHSSGFTLLEVAEAQGMLRSVVPEWTVTVVDGSSPRTGLVSVEPRRAQMELPLTVASMAKRVGCSDPSNLSLGLARAVALYEVCHEAGHLMLWTKVIQAGASPTEVAPNRLVQLIRNVVDDGFINGRLIRQHWPGFAPYVRLIGEIDGPRTDLDQHALTGPLEMATALLQAFIQVLNFGAFWSAGTAAQHFTDPFVESYWERVAPLLAETLSPAGADHKVRERIGDDVYAILCEVLQSDASEGSGESGQGGGQGSSADAGDQDQNQGQGSDSGAGDQDQGEDQGQGSEDGSDGASSDPSEEVVDEMVRRLGMEDGSDCAFHGDPQAERGAPPDLDGIPERAEMSGEVEALERVLEKRAYAEFIREAPGELIRLDRQSTHRWVPLYAGDIPAAFGIARKPARLESERLRRAIGPLLARKQLRKLNASSGKGVSLRRPTEVGMACSGVSGSSIWRAPLREQLVNEGMDAMMVIDVSGSMGCGADTKMHYATVAMLGLAMATRAWPSVRLGAVAFADYGGDVLPLSSQVTPELLLARLYSAYAQCGGGTCLAPPLLRAGAELAKREDKSRTGIVFLLTDAAVTPLDFESCKSVKAFLAAAGIGVIGVAFPGTLVEQLAEISDGLVDVTADPQRVAEHLRKVMYGLMSHGIGPEAAVA